ncbi:family 1 putative glycosyltransferase [Triangularia verruculosa]|uniref:Family 1 putative glycosyltransferase n=1 Tax=Triangularia verruculosa TaxID=2587418 RepID=A0AAN6XHP7_9PEZI|nr:family 1 putative glycosyltransferase [Triangularia verruculosa]
MAGDPDTPSPEGQPTTPQQESQAIDDNLRLVTEVQDGQKVTVVRDTEDRIVYPTYVPPATRSPVSGRSPSSSPPSPKTTMAETNQDHAKQEEVQSTKGKQQEDDSNTQQVQTEQSERTTSPRPQARNWATEFPQPDRVFTAPPPPRRAGTNLSAVPPGMEYSSSDSSSDDEDYRAPSPKKHRRKKKSKKQTEDDEDRFRKFKIGSPNYRTRGKVSKRDGRLSISLKDTSNTGYLAKALGTAAKRMVPLKPPPGGSDSESSKSVAHFKGVPAQKRTPSAIDIKSLKPPKLNIAIMVIGSRGDAQPFLKIGKILKEKYGHRVRIATHPAFRDFVEQDSGLEFFSVGGDPSELMSFMVKNPGMIPTLSSVKAGDIQKRRAAMAEMFQGFWRACINATDDEHDVRNIKMMGKRDPFVADAIIANPPSFAHIHCAEALGIPLHLMFTFPYTPTQAFPHPLASIKKSNVDAGYTNFISYPLVEMMVWQGLGDLVNEFRVGTLGLDPVSTLWAPGATFRLHVPFTYLWSPGLVPKPADWGEEVDVAGFVFLDLASSFKPPEDLVKFLEKSDQGKGEGEERDEKPVIYIGFGSIVVDDANRFTEMIFEAVEMAGVRALVSKGWGGLGGDKLDVPEDVYMLDNTPHDWLFPRVKACVIHGGAGTTAIALKCGKPTMIVPFFGDQHFWGSMLGNAGAGPEAVPYKNLTAEKLAEGIKYCLTDEAREAAEKIAKDIEREGDGAENACDAFHKGLLIHREVKGGGRSSMRCSILPDQVAVWQMKETGLRLSPMAAEMLVERGLVSWKKLRLLRHNEWNDFEGPGEPLTGVAGSVMGTVGNIFGGIGGVPYRVAKSAKKRKDREKGKDKKKDKKSRGEGDKSQQNGNDEENGEEVPQVETATTHAIDDRRSDSSSLHSNPAEEVAHHVGRGALKSASAIAKAPVDLSLALAQGFHNAPRLYGDDTVRRPIRVTGIKSGLKAARNEFAYGIYDGVTGVVRLPYRGAKEAGVGGFVRGVGMGLTGFVLKDLAAIIGPVGYTLKGVVKQVERGKQPIKYIRRARIVQGERDTEALSEEEKMKLGREAVKGWSIMWRLWAEMVRQEKKKRGRSIKAKLGGKARRHRKRKEWDVVFESVEVAERALEALRKGEDMDEVLERVEKERGSGHSPVTVTDGQPKMLEDGGVPKTTDGKDFGAANKEADADTMSTQVPSPLGTNDVGSGSGENGTVKVKDEEKKEEEEEENPFSVATPAIAKNLEENRMTMEAIEVKA